ncbi:EAL domain-containing protein [Spirulina sp. CCNP1310]|uniref:sensor domain-containing protein n=1 Tax=Spirulina sp. CCNP1310 TaxID=3110249 RepID=UPI002B20A3AF|nr:EAL domain-containing protein [Spirulina sp. CCNP1310]MEA5417583.1 EAL domain-containing protein [Spirulina sp. CCNP1310]
MLPLFVPLPINLFPLLGAIAGVGLGILIGAAWPRGQRRDLPLEAANPLVGDSEWVQTLFDANPAFFLALTPAGKIAMMNRAMLNTLGYQLPEVFGADFIDACIPPDHREEMTDFILQVNASLGLSIHISQLLTRSGQVLTVEWQAKPIVRRDRTSYEFCFLAGMDITERQRAEEELHLLHSVTQSVSLAIDFDQALREVLALLCEATGWGFGAVWVPNHEQTHLEISPVRYYNSHLNRGEQECFSKFWQESQDSRFAWGEGLPGQVWQSQLPQWIPDLSQLTEAGLMGRGSRESIPLCDQAIATAGKIRACLLVPIIAEGQVLAVLEFAMLAANREEPRLVELVASVAMQLGGVFQRKRAEALSQAAEAKYRGIFENAVEGIFQLDSQGHYLNVNPALAAIYGYESVASFLAIQAQQPVPPYVQPERYEKLLLQLQIHGEVKEFESQIYRRDGRVIWISENARRICDPLGAMTQNQPLVRYEGCVVDITSRKLAEENLRYNATHDALTGLWNRAYFLKQVTHCLIEQQYVPAFAVLFLDLDGFKLVNDSLGHWLGDALLVAIARRLQTCLRPTDTLARLGGDEFTILITPLGTNAAAIALANKILKILAEPFDIAGHRVFTGASIGIVPHQPHYRQAEELLQDADIAMYRAKAQGKNRAVCFDPLMRQAIVRRQQLDTDLRSAIQQNQLCLYYQPIMNLQTQTLIGFEALIRWQHPTAGWLSPSEFIPLAEERGQIEALGEWVLRQACIQGRLWQEQFRGYPLTMSVNLSSRQLKPQLSDRIALILAETGLNPKTLKLEITETALMDDPQGAIAILKALRGQKIQICIDDFGTGYCSLSYLHRFPLDVLKIDKSFIDYIDQNSEDMEIVRAIISLAQGLNLSIIAEGIESIPQLEMLRQLDCPYGQGYLFFQPLTVETATQLLKQSLVQPSASP